LLDLDGHDTALTPAGTTGYLVTVDGKFVLVQTKTGTYELYPIGGGDAKPFPFLQPNEHPVRFSSDGKELFVRTAKKGSPGADLYRLSVATGARTLMWHLQSTRTAVANEIALVDVTPDGTGYAYGYRQKSTVLYAVIGLK
jgi:hypothetical protein